jgi:hypothetical protein
VVAGSNPAAPTNQFRHGNKDFSPTSRRGRTRKNGRGTKETRRELCGANRLKEKSYTIREPASGAKRNLRLSVCSVPFAGWLRTCRSLFDPAAA